VAFDTSSRRARIDQAPFGVARILLRIRGGQAISNLPFQQLARIFSFRLLQHYRSVNGPRQTTSSIRKVPRPTFTTRRANQEIAAILLCGLPIEIKIDQMGLRKRGIFPKSALISHFSFILCVCLMG
jgi:hypothetical protein